MKRQLLKSSGALTLGQVVSQGLVLIRSIVIARMIGPHHFGIGASMILTASLIEMCGNLNAEKMLVQARDGDDCLLQRSVHLLQFVRGVAGAVVLLVVASPLSSLFGAPEAAWAFMCLAAIPLFGGLRHSDPIRLNRELRFGPELATELSHQLVGLTVAVSVAWWWRRDYSAVLWGLMAQWIAFAIVSNLVAERPYRWSYEARHVWRLLRFGGPLVLNGLLMFIIFQGDRVIIGSAWGAGALGIYSVAVGLTLMPALLAGRVGTSLLLPVMASSQHSPAQFLRRYTLCMQALALVAAILSVGFVIAGGRIVLTLYGERYAEAAKIIGWLGVAQAIYILRVGTTVGALAKGDTLNSIIGSAARVSALAGVGIVVALRHGLVWIAICAVLGELLALAASVLRLRRRHTIPVAATIAPAGLFIAAAVASGAASMWLGGLGQGWLGTITAAGSIMVVTGLLFYVSCSSLRCEVRAAIGAARRGIPVLVPDVMIEQTR